MIASRMRRGAVAFATFALVASYASVAAPADAATKPACYDFTNQALYPTLSGSSSTEVSNRIKALQDVLEFEGRTISSSEKSPRSFGESTAAAVVESQQKNLAKVKTMSGDKTYRPTGYVDSAYVKYLQQTYGCNRVQALNIVTPNGGETATVGSDFAITWTSTADVKSAAKVDLYLIDESGSTERREKIASPKNSKRYVWKVPRTLGSIDMGTSKSAYRIEIVAPNGDVDESNARFTIAPPNEGAVVVGPTAGSIIAGSATTTKITANSIIGTSKATVRLVKANGSSPVELLKNVTVTNLQKGLSIKIPDATAAGTYKVEVDIDTTTGGDVVAYSAEFTVLAKTTAVDITSPRGTILQGASTTTVWTFRNVPTATPVFLRLIDSDGDVVTNLVSSGLNVNSKKATIKIPTNATPGDYTVRLEATITGGATVVSESPTFRVEAPNNTPRVENVNVATSSVLVATNFDITWTFANLATNVPVTIKLMDGNTEVANLVTTGLTVNAKKRTVSLPTFVSAGDYTVKVIANPVGGRPVSATSNEFEVRARDAASVTVTKPDGESVLQGTNLTATWDYAGMLTTVPTQIRLADENGNVLSTIVKGPAVSKKTMTFKIPATTAAGTYRIQVDANIPGGRTISGISETFTVTAPDLTPRLEIAKPIGGTVVSGKATTTTWTFANIVTSTPIVISLVDSNDAHVANLVTTGLTVNAKTRAVTIPAATPDGTYKIKIVANVKNGQSVTAIGPAFVVDKP